MCGSQGTGIGSACCPPAHIFQEQICGNFNAGTTGITDEMVFVAPAGDYFEGTFQLFNSAASPESATVKGTINTSTTTTPVGPIPPGNTFTVAVKNPISFLISALPGASGTYCITLYKRVLA